jgi:hypothetical protein
MLEAWVRGKAILAQSRARKSRIERGSSLLAENTAAGFFL